MLAITRAERDGAPVLARPLQLVPASRARRSRSALNKVSNAILRLFGVDPERHRGAAHRRGPEGDHPPARHAAARSTPARR